MPIEAFQLNQSQEQVPGAVEEIDATDAPDAISAKSRTYPAFSRRHLLIMFAAFIVIAWVAIIWTLSR